MNDRRALTNARRIGRILEEREPGYRPPDDDRQEPAANPRIPELTATLEDQVENAEERAPHGAIDEEPDDEASPLYRAADDRRFGIRAVRHRRLLLLLDRSLDHRLREHALKHPGDRATEQASQHRPAKHSCPGAPHDVPRGS